MKRRNYRENNQPLVMIIPMIDIMLFLLVFFMLSTIYMVQTNNFQVTLPQSETAQQQENKPNVIEVTVMANGEIMFEDEKVQKNQLAQKISETLSADNETVFVLLGDKMTRYEQVVNVLEVMKKSGIKHISIATEVKNNFWEMIKCSTDHFGRGFFFWL